MSGVEQILRRLMSALWWIVCPAFAVMVLRFSYERACLNPYELLQPIMRHQAGALAIAAIYVGAYIWFVVAAVLTARAWDVATARRLQAIWGNERFKIFALAGALALEQVPRAIWAWIYRAAGVC